MESTLISNSINMFKRISQTLTLVAILLFVSSSLAHSSEIFVFSTHSVEALLIDLKKSGTVSGTVKEANTGDELIGANVVIKGTLKGASVDIEGKFNIRNVDAGPQILVVTYLGFQTKEIPIEVIDGENIEVNFVLEPQGVLGEEVIITAQARGQVAAINQQLSSNTISNVVSKDRIEELPDVNAAESIGRMPGISLQRSGGEANKVVIRGLSPKYNTVTINGVRVPSSDTDNRSVDLSLISSNMLDGIEVTKALTADKDADAIGGTIDLKIRTASPGWAGDFQLQGGYTALQNTTNNYKFVGSVGNRFFDNKLGVIANLNTDSYDRSADFLSGNYGDTPSGNGTERDIFPEVLNLNENSLSRSRIGGSLIVDYIIPKGKIVYNSILNQLTNDSFNRGNELDYRRAIHKYSLNNGYNETKITANSIALEQDFGWISYDALVSQTGSLSESPDNYYSDFMEESAVTISNDPFSLTPQEFPDLFLNDLEQTGLLTIQQSDRKTEEAEQSVQLNVRIPFEIGNLVRGYVKTGAKYRGIERSNDQNSRSVGAYYGGGRSYREAVAVALPELNLNPINRFPLSAFQSDYSSSNFLSGDYPLGYSIDPALMVQLADIAIEGNYMAYSRSGSLGRDYEGTEDFGALYLMTEFDLGEHITFLPGVRWESEATDYSAKYSTALEPAAGIPLDGVSFRDTTTTRDNSFLLPMIHLQVKPNDWINLRLAYTQSISRPDFRQFAPITYFSAIGGFANAPNKDLKSSKSVNYDASLSVYRNKLGFFTASLFYKEIEDLIWGISFNDIEGQQILPDLEIAEAGGNAIRVNTVINNPFKATIQGYELDWQTNFWYLPSVFKGLVLNVNYTHITSETKVPAFRYVQIPIVPAPRTPPFFEEVLIDTSVTQNLPDQPNDILNISIGYDFKGFSTRLSFFYQLGSVINKGSLLGSYDDLYKEEYFRVDMSIKQQLPHNFQVYANLNNLNTAGDENYQSPRFRYPRNLQYYGFTMDVGFRYKF